MDYQFEKTWNETITRVSAQFGEKLDYAAILFLIGVQEHGKDYQNFKKDQKVELMHIGICSLLVPYGYYTFVGRDEDGWPHYQQVLEMPKQETAQQEKILKINAIRYFQDWEKE